MTSEAHSTDVWSRWLLQRWHGGDSNYQSALRSRLEAVRDKVLDGAQLTAGMTLADIGAGDGLLGFGAIERLGSDVLLVFNDVSGDLLEHVRGDAEKRGVLQQCIFVRADAERLDGIADAMLDAVVTRASIAYVADKRSAFKELYRILKPGGRLSIAEPVLQGDAFAVCALARHIQSQPDHPQMQFARLYHRFRSAQFPSTEQEITDNPLTNYTERELLQFTDEAGFVQIHGELHIDYRPPLNLNWDLFLDIAPHPWAPTPREILSQFFSSQERQIFEQGLRPRIESSRPVPSDPLVYITARKPING
jgi:arsenite methyltransferase